MNTISLIPLSGIPAVSAGSDLTAVLLTALEDIAPKEGDLLVLTHKVLSKANGLTIALSDVRPSAQAEALSRATGKDPRLMEVILENCNTVYACDRGILIAERRDGWVCCNAGVDASNAGAPDTLYRDWILACRAAGAAVYLDAEGELLRQGVTAGPALIKPNQAELSGVMGRPLTTEDETIRAAQELLAQGVGCVAVTMGAGGALLCWEDCVLRCESPRVPVGSTVGAGDSVVAALAYAQQRQLSREDTARLAMATGAANVMCSGTQAARLGDIEQLLPQVRITRL